MKTSCAFLAGTNKFNAFTHPDRKRQAKEFPIKRSVFKQQLKEKHESGAQSHESFYRKLPRIPECGKAKPRNMIRSQSYACDHGNYSLLLAPFSCATAAIPKHVSRKQNCKMFLVRLGEGGEKRHAAYLKFASRSR